MTSVTEWSQQITATYQAVSGGPTPMRDPTWRQGARVKHVTASTAGVDRSCRMRTGACCSQMPEVGGGAARKPDDDHADVHRGEMKPVGRRRSDLARMAYPLRASRSSRCRSVIDSCSWRSNASPPTPLGWGDCPPSAIRGSLWAWCSVSSRPDVDRRGSRGPSLPRTRRCPGRARIRGGCGERARGACSCVLHEAPRRREPLAQRRRMLRAAGFEAVHVLDLGLVTASDDEIFDRASAEGSPLSPKQRLRDAAGLATSDEPLGRPTPPRCRACSGSMSGC